VEAFFCSFFFLPSPSYLRSEHINTLCIALIALQKHLNTDRLLLKRVLCPIHIGSLVARKVFSFFFFSLPPATPEVAFLMHIVAPLRSPTRKRNVQQPSQSSGPPNQEGGEVRDAVDLVFGDADGSRLPYLKWSWSVR